MDAYLELMDLIRANAPELYRRLNGTTWTESVGAVAKHCGYRGTLPNFVGATFSERIGHPIWGQILAFVCPSRSKPAPAPAPAPNYADIQHAATQGRNTERDRILARLNAIKPGEEPYSKPKSEWERQGAMRLWQRIREAIVDGKEAHKDRDALEGHK